MKRMCRKYLNRRELLAGAAATAAIGLPYMRAASAPANTVSIQRCRTYDEFPARLAAACDEIGGVDSLFKNKTVALKINLTGGPEDFPVTPNLPFRTDSSTVAALVHLMASRGAKRVRIIESFFPAQQDLGLWARYGLNVNLINNLGVPVVWDNVQNLGHYKRYTRVRVPFGGYMYPAYHLNPALVECDTYVSLAKLKDHATNGVTLSGKNNFGNTPCSLYGGDCGPNGNEEPTEVRVDVLHKGTTKAPAGVDAELHPESPRDPGYRVPRVTADQMAIRPIDLAIIDGVQTVRGGEGPWVPGVEKMTPGLIVVGRNAVCTDAVAMAAMNYDPRAVRGSKPFQHGDNHLLLAEAAGLGSTDLNRIEVVGVPLSQARVNFGPGSVGKRLSELRS